MKHAIVILAHNNVNHLIKFISYFGKECDIYIHYDKNSSISDNSIKEITRIKNVVCVYRNYSVHWGGFSLLKCQLFMMRQAVNRSNPDYVHIFSGSDYPIRSYETFIIFFSVNNNLDFMNYAHIPNKKWDRNTFSRFQFFYFFDWFKVRKVAQRANARVVKLQKRLHIKRRIPDNYDCLYGGSQWMSLKGSTVSFLLQHLSKNRAFYRRLKFTFAAEEVLIQTVLLNLLGDKNVFPNSMRFIRWKYENNNRPAVLGVEHFKYLVDCNSLFARKFEMGVSDGLINLIDKYLIHDDEQIIVMETGGWIYDGYLKYEYDNLFLNYVTRLCNSLCIQTVLDVGCGCGFYVAKFREKGINASGFDANPYVEILSKRFIPENDAPCECVDLTSDFIVEDKFELTICKDVLHYIPSVYIDRVLINLKKTTCRYLLVSLYNKGSKDKYANSYEAYDEIRAVALFYKYGFVLNEDLSFCLNNDLNSNQKYFLFTLKD